MRACLKTRQDKTRQDKTRGGFPKKIKCELYNDSMQGWKCYPIQKAQLIIADVPYNVGKNFYGSNPVWYKGGDNKNGESDKAGKAAFNSDFNFNLFEYFHFCSRLMKKDDTQPCARGRSSNSPCMIVFCSWEQQFTLIQAAKKHGFVNHIPLVFIKNYSPQVLKANMRVVGATEYAILFYRDRLPKFRNGLQIDENGKNIPGTGHMVFNWFEWERDGKEIPKIHPAQKPVKVLKKLIETFTDPYDVVIDPCFGSGATARAALELNRHFYGFEIDKKFYKRAKEEMIVLPENMDGATRRNRMNKCIYCSSEKRVCSLCTPNMYGGKAEVYIKRVTEHDYPVLELSYYKGKSVERDCMVLNFCPMCGRDLGKENTDD